MAKPDRIVTTSTEAKQGDPRSWTMVRVLKYSLILAVIAGVVLYVFYFGKDSPTEKAPPTAPAPTAAPAPAPAAPADPAPAPAPATPAPAPTPAPTP